jgi:hypothetical protein
LDNIVVDEEEDSIQIKRYIRLCIDQEEHLKKYAKFYNDDIESEDEKEINYDNDFIFIKKCVKK